MCPYMYDWPPRYLENGRKLNISSSHYIALSHVPFHVMTIDLIHNPKMHLFYIPQSSIQNRNLHIHVLNGALWGMEQVHAGICEIGLLSDSLWWQRNSLKPYTSLIAHPLDIKYSHQSHDAVKQHCYLNKYAISMLLTKRVLKLKHF